MCELQWQFFCICGLDNTGGGDFSQNRVSMALARFLHCQFACRCVGPCTRPSLCSATFRWTATPRTLVATWTVFRLHVRFITSSCTLCVSLMAALVVKEFVTDSEQTWVLALRPQPVSLAIPLLAAVQDRCAHSNALRHLTMVSLPLASTQSPSWRRWCQGFLYRASRHVAGPCLSPSLQNNPSFHEY